MTPDQSPFTNATELKELPHPIEGTFAWLTNTPTHDEWAIGDEKAGDLPSQLASVVKSANANGITLPREFTAFIGNPSLHRHLRSANGDYLDLAETVLAFAGGYLIRFLADQQGCAFWYIFTNGDASDHCVVSSHEYFDADDMDYELDELKETDFHIWESSFEAFLSRFWIEHEIMFADSDETAPPDVHQRFLDLYTQ
jgi:hypothetical protein